MIGKRTRLEQGERYLSERPVGLQNYHTEHAEDAEADAQKCFRSFPGEDGQGSLDSAQDDSLLFWAEISQALEYFHDT